MASGWTEEESFACPVCLETLKDPATLPCGHSYCLACIQSHWDKGGSKGEYTCPQCRQVFNPRPSLARSTLLAEAMEKLRTNSLKQHSFTAPSPGPPSMPIYLEVLPDTVQRKGSVYPQLPSVEPKPCHQHGRPLDLFCHDDRESVCEVCCQHGHRGHRVVKPKEERKERQKELVQMQAEVQRRLQETDRKIKELPHFARQHKALVQALEKESTDLFMELAKNVNLTGTQVSELLSTHEASLGSQTEGQLNRLEQQVAQLNWKSEELSRLADMQDDVCFLKNFLLMEPLVQTDATVIGQEETMVASVRSVMKELQESVQDLCKGSLEKIITIVNNPLALTTNGPEAAGPLPTGPVPAGPLPTGPVPAGPLPEGPLPAQVPAQSTVYEMKTDSPPLPPLRPQGPLPSRSGGSAYIQASAPPPPLPAPHRQASVSSVGFMNPEPKTRDELIKFRFEPTMDPNTVYRRVLLSDGNRKATMRAENLNPPDHPDRFQFWRQVLCKEPLGGSPYYWEVEWTGQKVTIAVSYKEIERKSNDDKSRLGHNELSWSLYWSGSGFYFWHNNQEKLLGAPKARRIGIYLDQHAGILAFYSITKNQANLIHRHQQQFSGPLFPGFRFWAGVGATVTICQLD